MCPKCIKKSFCSCSNCIKPSLSEGEKYYVVEDDTIPCPYCGYKGHHGEWEDYEYDQLMKREGVNSLTELVNKRSLLKLHDK